MWIKTIIKSLLLIALSVLIGYGWFRFGVVFEPAFNAQHTEATNALQSLPPLAPDFKGTIGRTYRQSKPDYPQLPGARPDAPNILLILTDDVGFASASTFGGPVRTQLGK